jgi:hypothetical protein
MVLTDIIWMGIIIATTTYLLYHSLWKKKGRCPGCSGCSCAWHPGLKTGKIKVIKGDNK